MSEQRLIEIAKKAELEGDKETAVEALRLVREIRQKQPEPSMGEKLAGVGETMATLGSAMAAEPVAGAAGALYAPLMGEDAAEIVRGTREMMTYQPRTQVGQESLMSVARPMEKYIGDPLQKAEQFTGDIGYETAGPVGGAIGASVPTAIGELTGGIVGAATARAGKRAKRIAEAGPTEQQQAVIEAGEAYDVPVLTTDVVPPKTYVGTFMQSLNEKLGVMGSGKARQTQQAAREAAVQGLADNMDIDLDSDFATDIVKSLNRESARKLQQAGNTRKEAVTALDKHGEVPLNNTVKAIDEQIAKQKALKQKANESIIQSLEDTKASIVGGNFTQLKNIRTEIISDLLQARKGDDTARLEPVYQAVKSAMDNDMMDFAKAKDRTAAAKWSKSNREFAEELEVTKRTELKRILKSGQATPEKVIPLLKGGKKSELTRLYNALDDQGKTAAKKAIIQDALKDSRFFEVDESPNPNAFATAMNKANRQQAVNVFFKGASKKEIDGLTRLLAATRRAQEASVAPKTGEIMTLPAIGAAGGTAAISDPFIGIPTITAISGLAKAYESKAFRKLLIKLGNTKKGSPAETKILGLAAPTVGSALQVAKEEQE